MSNAIWHLTQRPVVVLTAVALCPAILGAATNTSQAVMQDFEITNSSRPLNDALSRVASQLKVPVDFEEAPFALQTSGPLRSLPVHFVPGEGDALAAVRTIVDADDSAGFSARYTVAEDGNVITVVPAASQNVTNSVSPRVPISEVPVTIPYESRTIAATVDLIAAQISRVSGATVKVLNQPYLLGERVILGASNEPAISVLNRLSGLAAPTSFKLIYDPVERNYYLNLSLINKFTPNQSGFAATKLTNRPPASSPLFTKDK